MCRRTRHHRRVMKTVRWLSLLVALVLLAAACDDGGDVDRRRRRAEPGGQAGDAAGLQPQRRRDARPGRRLRGLRLRPAPRHGQGAVLLRQPRRGRALAPSQCPTWPTGRTSSRTTAAPTPSGSAGVSSTPRRSTARSWPRTSSTRSSASSTPSTRSPNPYARLISGVDDFAAGKARTDLGHAGAGDHTLQITLDQPASDFPSILTLPFFSPVPEEHASRYRAGRGLRAAT